MRQLEQFLDSIDSDHTRRAYQTDLGRYLNHLEGGQAERAVEDAEAADVQRFLDEMNREGLSESTRRRRFSAVRRFYDWLVEHGEASWNPARASSVSLDHTPNVDASPRFLSKEDLESVVAAAGGPSATGVRDRAIVLLIIYGALRRSELAALDIGDIRPLARHWVIDLPGNSGGRGGFVKIPSVVAEAVQKATDTYDSDQGALWQSFSNRNQGERLSPDALYKRVRHLGRIAGLDGLDIETLRRSGLRLAAQSGARPDQIQTHARLQHPTSTLRYFEAETGGSRLRNTAGDLLDLEIGG